MELKKYQQSVLDDLDSYIEELEKQPTNKAAFRSYWAKKGVPVDSVESEFLRPYNDEITGVPNVTIKVPTAGGKTYLACRALKHIFTDKIGVLVEHNLVHVKLVQIRIQQ